VDGMDRGMLWCEDVRAASWWGAEWLKREEPVAPLCTAPAGLWKLSRPALLC
jgi:hypothetical protein